MGVGEAGGLYDEADNKRQKWRTGEEREGAGLGLANPVDDVVLLARSQKMIISAEINFPTLMVQVQSLAQLVRWHPLVPRSPPPARLGAAGG